MTLMRVIARTVSGTCKRGHPWTPENTKMQKGGLPRCRTCIRERETEARRARGRLTRSETMRRRWADPEARAKFVAAFNGPRRLTISEKNRGRELVEEPGSRGMHVRAAQILPIECALADETCSGRLEVAFSHDTPTEFRRYHRSGTYSVRVQDYRRLCRSHHGRYDKAERDQTRVLRVQIRDRVGNIFAQANCPDEDIALDLARSWIEQCPGTTVEVVGVYE